ncbi:MAG: hypothetical protein ACRD20_09080 [Terriglobales bacterium]
MFYRLSNRRTWQTPAVGGDWSLKMPVTSLNPFKSLNRYFLICKIAVLLSCLGWPVAAFVSLDILMSHVNVSHSMFEPVVVYLLCALLVFYPIVFFGIVLFAERVLARKSYRLATFIAFLPIAAILVVAIGYSWLRLLGG